jgi:hypothetical protein
MEVDATQTNKKQETRNKKKKKRGKKKNFGIVNLP